MHPYLFFVLLLYFALFFQLLLYLSYEYLFAYFLFFLFCLLFILQKPASFGTQNKNDIG